MASWIKIKATIIPFENIAWFVLLSKFYEFKKRDLELSAALETKRAEYTSSLSSKEKTIGDYEDINNKLESELDHYKTHYMAAINQREDLARQLAEVNGAYQLISNSTSWKITKPLRAIFDLTKKILRSNRITHNFYKGIICLKQHGMKYTWSKVKSKFLRSLG
jgi:predicted RNase H-like nuclease (RuvC/YqgF family)